MSILQELIDNQLKDVPPKLLFTHKHLTRLSKSLPTSIFDPTKCCIWSSYVCKDGSSNNYIRFYMRGQQYFSQRLIYLNYCGPLPNHFIRSNCSNKSRCCNINHMTKVEYRSKVKVKVIRNPIQTRISRFKYHGTIKKLNLPKVQFISFYLNFD